MSSDHLVATLTLNTDISFLIQPGNLTAPAAVELHGLIKAWLSYTILYYTIHYTILYYTILYYTILYYTILYYTILYYTILYYTILY